MALAQQTVDHDDLRARPIISPNVSSATAWAPGPGIRRRSMPRDPTASRSRLSRPEPARTRRRSPVAAASTPGDDRDAAPEDDRLAIAASRRAPGPPRGAERGHDVVAAAQLGQGVRIDRAGDEDPHASASRERRGDRRSPARRGRTPRCRTRPRRRPHRSAGARRRRRTGRTRRPGARYSWRRASSDSTVPSPLRAWRTSAGASSRNDQVRARVEAAQVVAVDPAGQRASGPPVGDVVGVVVAEEVAVEDDDLAAPLVERRDRLAIPLLGDPVGHPQARPQPGDDAVLALGRIAGSRADPAGHVPPAAASVLDGQRQASRREHRRAGLEVDTHVDAPGRERQ